MRMKVKNLWMLLNKLKILMEKQLVSCLLLRNNIKGKSCKILPNLLDQDQLSLIFYSLLKTLLPKEKIALILEIRIKKLLISTFKTFHKDR